MNPLKWFSENQNWAALPLRIVLAVVFIVAGYGKLFGGLDKTAGFFDSIGIPFASITVFLVAFIELFGGILILLGLFTRYVSILLSIIMVFAIILVHLTSGYNTALLALGGSLALLFLGSGPLSLDKLIFKN